VLLLGLAPRLILVRSECDYLLPIRAFEIGVPFQNLTGNPSLGGECDMISPRGQKWGA